jgi:hypothetical protein
MGLSVDNLPEGGSGINKVIQPGNVTAKINSVALEPYKFIEGAYHFVMNIETEPIDGFEGFMLDKDRPELGNYKGQIGKINASQYAFANGKTKSGIEIDRDRSILIFLKNLCNAIGCEEWFKAQNNKHNTIEDFVKAFNIERPFKEVFIDFCIGGKEYLNKAGYSSYNLWLPKSEKGAYAISQKDSGKTMTYNESQHLVKLSVAPVSSFSDDEDTDFTGGGDDFDLD